MEYHNTSNAQSAAQASSFQYGQQISARNDTHQNGQIAGSVPPSQSDLEILTYRAQEIGARLAAIASSAESIVGRAYGEGAGSDSKNNSGPRAAGMVSQMTDTLSAFEIVADRLDTAITRLSKLV